MWKLISADSGYNRWINIIQRPLIFIFVLANSILGNLEEVIAGLLFGFAILIGMAVSMESVKSKRTRLLAGLPVPVRQLGIYRHYRTVAGWSIWMALIFLSSLISQRGHIGLDYLWWRVACFGEDWLTRNKKAGAFLNIL